MRTMSAARTTTESISRDASSLGPAVHPGEILLEEFLKPLEMTQAATMAAYDRLLDFKAGPDIAYGDFQLAPSLAESYGAMSPSHRALNLGPLLAANARRSSSSSSTSSGCRGSGLGTGLTA